MSLKPGNHVLTRLTHIWTDGDCTLSAGTALHPRSPHRRWGAPIRTDLRQPTTSATPAAVDPSGSVLATLDGDAVHLYNLDPHRFNNTGQEQIGN